MGTSTSTPIARYYPSPARRRAFSPMSGGVLSAQRFLWIALHTTRTHRANAFWTLRIPNIPTGPMPEVPCRPISLGFRQHFCSRC